MTTKEWQCAPDGAQFYVDGCFFKFGLRGMLFVWDCELVEWVRSARDAVSISKGIEVSCG